MVRHPQCKTFEYLGDNDILVSCSTSRRKQRTLSKYQVNGALSNRPFPGKHTYAIVLLSPLTVYMIRLVIRALKCTFPTCYDTHIVSQSVLLICHRLAREQQFGLSEVRRNCGRCCINAVGTNSSYPSNILMA